MTTAIINADQTIDSPVPAESPFFVDEMVAYIFGEYMMPVRVIAVREDMVAIAIPITARILCFYKRESDGRYVTDDILEAGVTPDEIVRFATPAEKDTPAKETLWTKIRQLFS